MSLVSKLHPIVTHGIEFNKDARMYVKAGHMATQKKYDKRKGNENNSRIRYLFNVEKCKVCPFQEGCYKKRAKTKSYDVTIKSEEHSDQEAFQQTDEFKEMAKSR